MPNTRVKLNGLPDDTTSLTYVGVQFDVKDSVVSVPDDAPEGLLEAFLRDNPDHEVLGARGKVAAAEQPTAE